MPQVTVSIDNKLYRMACDEGQEDYLIELAQKFDQDVADLKDSFGEIGDQRLIIMAAIMLMDKLTELQQKNKGLQNEIKSLRKICNETLEKEERTNQIIIEILSNMSQRIEKISEKIIPK